MYFHLLQAYLEVEFFMVNFEAILHTQSSLAIRTPEHRFLLCLLFVTHDTFFYWVLLYFPLGYPFRELPLNWPQYWYCIISWVTPWNIPFNTTPMLLYKVNMELKMVDLMMGWILSTDNHGIESLSCSNHLTWTFFVCRGHSKTHKYTSKITTSHYSKPKTD